MSVFGERRPVIAMAALGFVVLNITLASTMVIAAYGFDPQLLSERGALVGSGHANPDLLRLAAFVDLVGYLALAPVVLYLHGRLRQAVPEDHRRLGLPAVVSAGGLGFVLVGAIGAVLLGSVGPWLLQASTDAAAQTSIRLEFGGLENAVIVGLWGTLELPLLAVWLVGVSLIVRIEGLWFAWVGIGAGLGALGYGIRTGLTGAPPLPISGPLDVLILAGVGLMPLWMLWLALRLWRGR